MAGKFYPNFAAPERAMGEYTGDPLVAIFDSGGSHGFQPQGDNNPGGDLPGLPVMTLTREAARTLEGPQPQ